MALLGFSYHLMSQHNKRWDDKSPVGFEPRQSVVELHQTGTFWRTLNRQSLCLCSYAAAQIETFQNNFFCRSQAILPCYLVITRFLCKFLMKLGDFCSYLTTYLTSTKSSPTLIAETDLRPSEWPACSWWTWTEATGRRRLLWPLGRARAGPRRWRFPARCTGTL